MRACLKTILSSYAEVFFLPGMAMGIGLLAITLLDPQVGAAGLASVLSAYGLARLTGMDRQMATQGFHIYNPLLVGLSVGHLFSFSPLSLFLAALAGALTFVVTACLAEVFTRSFRLPVLSLPFVIVSAMIYLASLRYSNLISNRATGPAILADDFGLPFWAAGFFKSVGALLFSPSVLVGIFISLLILRHSRILFLLALLGYGVGTATRTAMFGSALQACGDTNNFNFILIAMALGGIFLVPSLTSYLLASIVVAMSTVVMDATTGFWSYCGMPVLTFPFNVACLGMVFLLGLIRHRSLTLHAGRNPEETLEIALANRWRYTGSEATLYLPFAGRWTVWQGFDGDWTHTGVWRHAYDFVIADEQGATHAHDGEQLEDYYCFRKPVLAPVRGTVVKVVDTVPDSPIGNSDEANKWGNLVIIQDPRGFYVELSHFAQHGIQVKVGDWVERGTVLGLCGNSGYSPQPHIHVQVQATDVPGGATLPFSFVSYREGTTFYANHLPSNKSRVEALYPSKRLDLAMSFALDDQLEYRVLRKGREIDRLKLKVRMAPDGFLYFDSGRGSLYFGKHEGTFYMYRVTGNDPWLRLMFLGLPRLPLAARDGIQWTDHVPAYLIAGALGNGVIGLLSSFHPALAKVPVVMQFSGDDRVQTVAASRFLGTRKEVQVEINHRKGITRMSLADIQLERVGHEEP